MVNKKFLKLVCRARLWTFLKVQYGVNKECLLICKYIFSDPQPQQRNIQTLSNGQYAQNGNRLGGGIQQPAVSSTSGSVSLHAPRRKLGITSKAGHSSRLSHSDVQSEPAMHKYSVSFANNEIKCAPANGKLAVSSPGGSVGHLGMVYARLISVIPFSGHMFYIYFKCGQILKYKHFGHIFLYISLLKSTSYLVVVGF